MTTEEKTWIDNATYYDLLKLNRFGARDNPMFQGETGRYFVQTMNERRYALPPEEAMAISKRIGWEQ